MQNAKATAWGAGLMGLAGLAGRPARPLAAPQSGSAPSSSASSLRPPKRGPPRWLITHHAPTPRSVGPRFEGDPCNAAFASDLEGVIAQYQPPLWIHGHMHNRVDVALGETRVLCNPGGCQGRRETRPKGK